MTFYRRYISKWQKFEENLLKQLLNYHLIIDQQYCRMTLSWNSCRVDTFQFLIPVSVGYLPVALYWYRLVLVTIVSLRIVLLNGKQLLENRWVEVSQLPQISACSAQLVQTLQPWLSGPKCMQAQKHWSHAMVGRPFNVKNKTYFVARLVSNFYVTGWTKVPKFQGCFVAMYTSIFFSCCKI